MQTETIAAKALRGTVKAVFILCYIAFMWASIHHIAAFYNGFEENSGNLLGSYLLAGAVDITALVTTIAVMFFRKSMPGWVFWIVWTFIVALAFYSFFINWEYANHYQSMTLVLQPTGETVPVYDTTGALHYVPAMRADTGLLWVNPVLASGFTIFSLIYSVVAEFFGTKAVTVEELEARKKYLQETASVLEEIKQLEEMHRKPSLIQRAKETVKEAKLAVKEVLNDGDKEAEDTTGNVSDFPALLVSTDAEPTTPKTPITREQNTLTSDSYNDVARGASSSVKKESKTEEDDEEKVCGINTLPLSWEEVSPHLSRASREVIKRYPAIFSFWLSRGIKSADINEIVTVTKQPKRRVQYQVNRALKTTPRNEHKILISSVIEWLKTAPLPEQHVVNLSIQNGSGLHASSDSNLVDLPGDTPINNQQLSEQQKEENNEE